VILRYFCRASSLQNAVISTELDESGAKTMFIFDDDGAAYDDLDMSAVPILSMM